MQNIAKKIQDMSEEFLCQRQDMLDENSEEFQLIDAELDRRADQFNIVKENQKRAKLIEEERRAELQAEFDKVLEENGKRCTMKAMFLEWGSEYFDDYTVDDVFTVHSSVAGTNNPSTWECEDADEAQKKIEMLCYYRIYDKYFRDGSDPEALDKLKWKIIEISKNEN